MSISRPSPRWTPRHREYHTPPQSNLSRRRHEGIRGELCERMCNMPAKQATHHSLKSPPPTNHSQPPFWTLPNGGYRPNHRSSGITRIQCCAYHYRSWMFKSGQIHPMHHHNHWSRSRSAIPPTPGPMVWHSKENHQ